MNDNESENFRIIGWDILNELTLKTILCIPLFCILLFSYMCNKLRCYNVITGQQNKFAECTGVQHKPFRSHSHGKTTPNET